MRTRWVIIFGVLFGVLTAAATTFYNRPYPGRAIGFGCAVTELNPSGLCLEQRPQGGFPLIHISDKRDGPNPAKLGPEDDIYPISIAGNVAAYTAIWMVLIFLFGMVTRRRAPAGGHAEEIEISPALAAAAAAAAEAAEAAAKPAEPAPESPPAAETPAAPADTPPPPPPPSA